MINFVLKWKTGNVNIAIIGFISAPKQRDVSQFNHNANPMIEVQARALNAIMDITFDKENVSLQILYARTSTRTTCVSDDWKGPHSTKRKEGVN